MSKYKVTLAERTIYFVTVEAPDEDAAMERAEECFVNAPDIRAFPCDVRERDAVNVEKVEG